MTTFPPRTNLGRAGQDVPTTSRAPDSRIDTVDHGVHGIVLAGSHRWGGSPFDRILRGPLVPIALTPVIAYPLAWLREGSTRGATICANSATGAVRSVIGVRRTTGMRLDFYEDDTPRGPAGCAADAARLTAAHTFVIVEGAMVPSLDLRALLRAHLESGAAATIVVEIERRRRALGADRRRLPGGVYVLDRRVLEQVPERGYHDIKEELLERLYGDGERVRTFEVQGITPRVLDFASYSSVSQWMIGRAIADEARLPGFVRDEASARHPSAIVDPTARLVGPVVLGHDVRIDADAVIVGPTAIGAGSRVMARAVVTRSTVWHGCTIGAGALVDATLLADGARVAAGAATEWEAIVGDGADALNGVFEPLPARDPALEDDAERPERDAGGDAPRPLRASRALEPVPA